MGRAPCCDKKAVRRGAWSQEEDLTLVRYIEKHGHGSWRTLPKNAGLLRCGKSCRLRWTNYLRPDIKRGPFSLTEQATIIQLHRMFGNKWAAIASQLPGRTDNEIKNFWNTHLKKRLEGTSGPGCSAPGEPGAGSGSHEARHMVQWESARIEAEGRLSMETLLLHPSPFVKVEHDYFLWLWNSEVGESFRRGEAGGGGGRRRCGSPDSQASRSGSVDDAIQTGHKRNNARPPPIIGASREQDDDDDAGGGCCGDHGCTCRAGTNLLLAYSDSNSCDGITDSSETVLKMLLDSPAHDAGDDAAQEHVRKSQNN